MAGVAVAAAWAAPGTEIRVDVGKLASLATIEFSPPKELTAAQGGVLLAEAVRDEHKLAWLVGAAADGYFDIDGDPTRFSLVRRPRPRDAERRDPWTAAQISRTFGSRKRVSLDHYDPLFARTWRAVGTWLEDWRRSSGLWDPAGERRCRQVRAFGSLAALVGLIGLVVGSVLSGKPGSPWPLVVGSGAAVAGAGLAAVVLSWELRVRTAIGSGLWLRAESFRRFLAESEAHHVEEAAARGLLLQYAAWAVAVGQVDRWSQAVAGSSVPPGDPGARVPMMAPYLPPAASTASTAPSSSSGGGSTGSSGSSGGVGGGSGGGGGGSW
jgi:hypothetical protein